MTSLSSSGRGGDGYYEYIDKIGQLVNGVVKRFYRGDFIVDLGNVEAILPCSQQSRVARWSQDERIRTVVTNVSEGSR